MSAAAVRPALLPRRCSCGASSPRNPGCISTFSLGRRRQNRDGPKAANARLHAHSMRCSPNAMAEQTAMRAFDPRLTPARADLAAKELEGKVTAARYVEGRAYEVIEPQAPLRTEPAPDAPLATEALKGERVTIYDSNDEGGHGASLRLTAMSAGCRPMRWLPSARRRPTKSPRCGPLPSRVGRSKTRPSKRCRWARVLVSSVLRIEWR